MLDTNKINSKTSNQAKSSQQLQTYFFISNKYKEHCCENDGVDGIPTSSVATIHVIAAVDTARDISETIE